MTPRDSLSDFRPRQFEFFAKRKLTYVAGSGPAVVLMAELPGITPEVARFARWVRDAGFTVYMPSLFGIDGANPSRPRQMLTVGRVCVSREFRVLASNHTSPITRWLRALAAKAFGECGGKGVGALGMCITGNFALALMLEPAVVAPVLCQPSLPFSNHAGIHLSPDDTRKVRERLETEGLTMLAYRFEGDSYCRAERFAAMQAALGPSFCPRTLPDSAARPGTDMKVPHSVVTRHLIDEAGQPTRVAVDEILAFFEKRLRADAPSSPTHSGMRS